MIQNVNFGGKFIPDLCSGMSLVEASGEVPAHGSCCRDKAKGAGEHLSPTQAVINGTKSSEQDKMMIFGMFIGKEIFEGAPSICVTVMGKRYLFQCSM